jgi:hypothetical protein
MTGRVSERIVTLNSIGFLRVNAEQMSSVDFFFLVLVCDDERLKDEETAELRAFLNRNVNEMLSAQTI